MPGSPSLLTSLKVKVVHCLTLCSPMSYTTHGILQARILEWVAFPFSRGCSQSRNRTQVSCIAGRFCTNCATREGPVCSDSCALSQWPPNHLILCLPLLLLPSVFPSFRVFSSESAFHIRWPKYWSFGFSSSPSNEYSGQISFKINWLDLLAVQGTLKRLLQHHSSKASILQCSAFSGPTLTSIHDDRKNHSCD